MLTGFLGAGKTTLLNRLLAAPDAGRVAVVVNEFGAEDIDGRLVLGASERVIALRDGCICCVVRDDLRAAVTGLLERRARRLFPLRFDRIIVETSGLASPGPVVQTFLLDAKIAAATRVDGVIALAHAEHLPAQVEAHPEVRAQLAYADAVVLNHGDQGDAEAARAVAAAYAPFARIAVATRADLPVSPLLDLQTADPSRWGLAEVAHTEGARSVALITDAPVDLARLKLFLQFVASRKTWEIWRIKGIVRCLDHPRPVVVHGIYQWLELGPGPGEPPARSVVVVLGRDLDAAEIRRAWNAITSG